MQPRRLFILVGLLLCACSSDGGPASQMAPAPNAGGDGSVGVAFDQQGLEPLYVTLTASVRRTDTSDPPTLEIAPLDGGKVEALGVDEGWALSTLSRYELRSGGGLYAPVRFEFRTGSARSKVQMDLVLTQGLRLTHRAEPVNWTLDHRDSSLVVGRPIQEMGALDFEYVKVSVDPSLPMGLSTRRLLTSRRKTSPPVFTPDAAFVTLWSDEGLRMVELSSERTLEGSPGAVDPNTIVFARPGVNVAAARRPDRTLVAWSWDNASVSVIFESPQTGRANGENPLAISGDGRTFGMIGADGKVQYFQLDPSLSPFRASPGPQSAGDADIWFSADSSSFYEVNQASGDRCGVHLDACEFRINGALLYTGLRALGVARGERPGALIVLYDTAAQTMSMRRHNPSVPGGGVTWPGVLETVEFPWLAALNARSPITVVGDLMLVQDPGTLHILDIATARELDSLPGVWTVHPRFDDSAVLREATRDAALEVEPGCPLAGTCRVHVLEADGTVSAPTIYSAGLPFGEGRDRLLKWRCDGPDCDPVLIQDLDTRAVRTVADRRSPAINDLDPARYLDAPCYVYTDGGATGFIDGAYCVY